MKVTKHYRFYLLLLAVLSGFFLFNCEHKKKKLGLEKSRLKPCPDSPNCVGSMEDPTDEVHYLEPLKMTGNLNESRNLIKTILAESPRVEIIVDEDFYLHAEFTTKIMRFVDDVEFYFDEENGLIHYRSASRVGYSDLGLNHKRMQEIRKKYTKKIHQ